VAVTQGSTALFVWPVLSSVVFLLSAVVLVPAFVRPDGLGGKLLALCGVERSVEESEASVHPGILADATADVHMSGILMVRPRAPAPSRPGAPGPARLRAARLLLLREQPAPPPTHPVLNGHAASLPPY